MTAGVVVYPDACESEVSKGEVGNVVANVVNGNVGIGNGNQSDNGVSKDDTDTNADGPCVTCVFVTRSDAIVSKDPVHSHLNSNVVQNNGAVGLHLEPQKDNSQSHLLNKAAAEAPHLNDGEVVVSERAETDQDPKEAEEVPMEDASRDLSQQTKHYSMPTRAPTPIPSLDEQVVGDLMSKETTADNLPACHAHEQNGYSENGHDSSAPIIFENASLQDATKSATQVVNGCVSDQSNGDGLLNIHVPLVTNDNDLLDTPEENDGSCENAYSFEKVAVGNGESFSAVADNDITEDQNAENGVSLPTEDVSNCSIDDVKLEADAVKITEKDSESPNPCRPEHSKSKIEAESGPVVDDTLSSCPADDAISEPNSKSKIETEIVPLFCDTPSSFPPNATILEESHSKSEVESEIAIVVNGTLSSFPPNDAISEESTSKSEVESVSVIIIDETLSSFPPIDAMSEEPNSISEVESESAPVVDDTLPSLPPYDAISEEPNSKSEVEFDCAPVVDDTLPSFAPNDAIAEEPISKSEVESESTPISDDTSSFPPNEAVSDKPNSKPEVESENAPIGFDTLSNFPLNDAISEEPNSKSEVEYERVPVIDETLSSFSPNDVISELNSKSEIEFKSVPSKDDTLSSFTANYAISDPKTNPDSVGCGERASNDATGVDTGLSSLEVEWAASPLISVSDNNSKDAGFPAKPNTDEKLVSEVQSISALGSRGTPDDDVKASESRVLNDSFVENGRPLTCNLDDVQIESDVNSTCTEVEHTYGILGSEPSTSSGEVSTADAVEGQNKGAEVEKKAVLFLDKVSKI